jgi:hypothetical protein
VSVARNWKNSRINLPAVEHEFERAEEGRNQHEADEIKPAPLLL